MHSPKSPRDLRWRGCCVVAGVVVAFMFVGGCAGQGDGVGDVAPFRVQFFSEATDLVFRGTVMNVEDIPSSGGDQLVRAVVTETIYDAATRRESDTKFDPSLPEGGEVDLWTWPDQKIEIGSSLVFFTTQSTIAIGDKPPYRSWLIFDSKGPIEGTRMSMVDSLDDLLRPDETLEENGLDAVVEFAREREIRGAAGELLLDPGPGPREQVLLDRIVTDSVTAGEDASAAEFLSAPVENRFVGFRGSRLPDDVISAIGIDPHTMHDALALVVYETSSLPLGETRRVSIDSVLGRSHITEHTMEKPAALLPLPMPAGVSLDVWERDAAGSRVKMVASLASNDLVASKGVLSFFLLEVGAFNQVSVHRVSETEFERLVLSHRP